MDIGDTKDLIYRLSIEVPLIIFVMILVSALVHVVSAGFAPMWSNFLLYGAQLSPFLIQLWTYSVPLLWLFLFGTTIYHGHRKPPDDNDPRARREKRAESQFRRRQSRKRFKYASIVDTQFHCSYPRRLHEQARYPCRAPCVMEREMAKQHDHLHSATLCVLDSVLTHGRKIF
jgi:hypothetical protein